MALTTSNVTPVPGVAVLIPTWALVPTYSVGTTDTLFGHILVVTPDSTRNSPVV